MTARLTRLLVLGVMLSGCAQTTPGTAHSEPAPPQFPDQTQYSAVPAERFFRPLRGGPSYQFVTPNQIHCRVTLGGIACSGNLPAVPDSVSTATGDGCTLVEGDLDASSHTQSYKFTRHGECPPFGGEHYPVLGEGQKTTLYMMQPATVTCGVGAGDVFACKDTDGHGFVLQPSGSGVF